MKQRPSNTAQEGNIRYPRVLAYFFSQRLTQDKQIAWRILPLFLLIFLAGFLLSYHTSSHLGEEGREWRRQGESHSRQHITVKVITPPSPQVPATPDQAEPAPLLPPTPPIVQEHKVQLEPLEIELQAATAPSLDTQIVTAPTLNASLMAFEEFESLAAPPQEVKKAAAPPAAKTAKATKVTKPAPAAIASQSTLGTASQKAAGRLSASYKQAPAPPYPVRMRAAKAQGSVLVRIYVDAQGQPTAVDIKNSSGHKEFDEIAQAWILQHWTFNPAQQNGQAIASIVTSYVHFVYS